MKNSLSYCQTLLLSVFLVCLILKISNNNINTKCVIKKETLINYDMLQIFFSNVKLILKKNNIAHPFRTLYYHSLLKRKILSSFNVNSSLFSERKKYHEEFVELTIIITRGIGLDL